MSRNFELLTQIDYDLDGTDQRTRVAADLPVVKTAAPSDNAGEEISRLVQSLFLSADAGNRRDVVFCGIEGESGSSLICASAGRTLASNSSRSVCLVDANVRSPRLSKIFGIAKAPFVKKSCSVRDQCVQISSNLWLAGADMLQDDRGALTSVDELQRLFAQLCGVFDYVLIDSPGIGISGDAAILGQIADAAVLIVEANSTRRHTARKAKETLEAAGVRLLGTVLHNREFPIPAGLYKRL